MNVEETRKIASNIMWGFRENDEVKLEGKRILAKHVHNSKPRTTNIKKQIKKTDD